MSLVSYDEQKREGELAYRLRKGHLYPYNYK